MSTDQMGSMERMFRHNNLINQTFLTILTEEELQLTDGRGGHSIFWLLAHTRSWSVKSISQEHALQVKPAMHRDQDGTVCLLVKARQDIQQILADGDEVLLDAVKAAAARGEPRPRPYIDPAMILARTFNHDAHHRGQIMTILRQHGVNHPELNRMLFTSWADL